MRPDGLLLLCLAVPLLAAGPAQAADPSPQHRVESRLMCYCGCADLTVRTCTCGTADGIRREIAERLASGETTDQVVAAFVARHGEKILSAPTKEGFNLLAWITPFVVLAIAAAGLIMVIVRWTRAAGTAGAPAAPAGGQPAALSAEDRDLLRRVEREIREAR